MSSTPETSCISEDDDDIILLDPPSIDNSVIPVAADNNDPLDLSMSSDKTTANKDSANDEEGGLSTAEQQKHTQFADIALKSTESGTTSKCVPKSRLSVSTTAEEVDSCGEVEDNAVVGIGEDLTSTCLVSDSSTLENSGKCADGATDIHMCTNMTENASICDTSEDVVGDKSHVDKTSPRGMCVVSQSPHNPELSVIDFDAGDGETRNSDRKIDCCSVKTSSANANVTCVTILDTDSDSGSDDIIFIKRTRKRRGETADTAHNSAVPVSVCDTSAPAAASSSHNVPDHSLSWDLLPRLSDTDPLDLNLLSNGLDSNTDHAKSIKDACNLPSTSSNPDTYNVPFKKRNFLSQSTETCKKTVRTSGSECRPTSFTCWSCGNGMGCKTGSTCLEGHRCCDMCLQARVKHILAKSSKVRRLYLLLVNFQVRPHLCVNVVYRPCLFNLVQNWNKKCVENRSCLSVGAILKMGNARYYYPNKE